MAGGLGSELGVPCVSGQVHPYPLNNQTSASDLSCVHKRELCLLSTAKGMLFSLFFNIHVDNHMAEHECVSVSVSVPVSVCVILNMTS
jgi:hypothetical protein